MQVNGSVGAGSDTEAWCLHVRIRHGHVVVQVVEVAQEIGQIGAENSQHFIVSTFETIAEEMGAKFLQQVICAQTCKRNPNSVCFFVFFSFLVVLFPQFLFSSIILFLYSVSPHWNFDALFSFNLDDLFIK